MASRLFGGAKKNVEQLLVSSWRYLNERKNLALSEEEIVARAKQQKELVCREDRLVPELSKLFSVAGIAQGDSVAVKVYLTAPYAKTRLPFVQAIGLRLLDSFGVVHMGLQVGPVRFDWMSDSFVHFKRRSGTVVEAGEAFARVVLDPTPRVLFLTFNEDLVRTLAEVISEWNREKVYHVVSANCQDFIGATLEALGTSFTPPSGAFAQYLRVLKLHPEKANVRFLPRGDDVRVEFRTHEALEEFHLKCREQARQQQQQPRQSPPPDPRYVLNDQEEALLKSFHRAFQFKEPADKHEWCMFKAPTVYRKDSVLKKNH